MTNKSKLISNTEDYENNWIKVVDKLPYHMQEVRVCIEHPSFGTTERFRTAVFLAFDGNFYDAEEQTQLYWVTKWRTIDAQIKNDIPFVVTPPSDRE